MTKYLENDAVLSDCGKYRYMLRRTWDHAKPRALLITRRSQSPNPPSENGVPNTSI